MKFLVFVFTIIPSLLSAQSDTVVTYTNVIKVDSATKSELYIRARDWFNNTFRNSNAVLQIQDKDAGEISGKGVFSSLLEHRTLGINNSWNQDFRFKVSVWVKEGRYKYEITDIDNFNSGDETTHVQSFGVLYSSQSSHVKFSYVSQKKTDALYVDTKRRAELAILGIIKSLIDTMNKKSSTDF